MAAKVYSVCEYEKIMTAVHGYCGVNSCKAGIASVSVERFSLQSPVFLLYNKNNEFHKEG